MPKRQTRNRRAARIRLARGRAREENVGERQGRTMKRRPETPGRVERPAAPLAGSSRASFTLVEMLAVMAIIAILAGIIVAGSNYAQRQSDMKRARAGLERIKYALEDYRAAMGRYPTNSVSGGVTNFVNGSMTNDAWAALTNYHRSLKHPDDLIDPWGRSYIYTNRSRFTYLLMSRGPDATLTNTWDDITNEQVGE
jgi:type II secretion system protein G